MIKRLPLVIAAAVLSGVFLLFTGYAAPESRDGMGAAVMTRDGGNRAAINNINEKAVHEFLSEDAFPRADDSFITQLSELRKSE
ncbi:MAG TPA: hypothetical protein PKK43_10755 [Spirochaetota bacterium]|nr:hypothetical protein [Spirochaetota bacterium]